EQLARDEAGEGQGASRAWGLVEGCRWLLATKYTGWKLFCDRLGIPHALCWSVLPGADRLEREANLSKNARPSAALKVLVEMDGAFTEANLITPHSVADEMEKTFLERARWWNGD